MQKSTEYKRICEAHAPKSHTALHSICAFLGGGVICAVGELLSHLYVFWGAKTEDAYLFVTLSFIFIGSLLTALGVFDKITNFIYAGTLLPVTGFSNSVTSSAIDAKCEGYILGVGSKIFNVAGPVILFGSIAGFLYGLVYFLVGLFI